VFEALERSKARGRLKRAFSTVDAVNVLAFAEKGLLTSQLCVISAGVLEESVRLHLSEYARVKSLGFVANFVTRRIQKLTNLNSEKLIELLRDLDPSLADEMATFLDDRRRSALNSLIALRHAVAHGKDSSTSLASVVQYGAVIFEILDRLDEVFQRIAV
jgi:hypothetical protein